MKQKLAFALGGLIAGLLIMAVIRISDDHPIQTSVIAEAEKLFGLNFTQAHRDSMIDGLRSNLEAYETLHQKQIGNEVWPAVQFNPIPQGYIVETEQFERNWRLPNNVELPEDRSELAYYSVAELGWLIREQKITSVELTELFLDRIRQYDEQLEVVITLTEDLAMEQARAADALTADGIWLGPLHGIPYGSKDLLALAGYPTTWGATPFRDQVIDQTATVLLKLEEAGAVHLAKLSLGALAWGDVWFDGFSRSPWNTDLGASGSSAGSASATAAGLVPFAIGSETLGSIVSPATRNGVTGLRPTYGRVSRHGAMALSWSMDKIGPLTRTAEDAAIVFSVIEGPDGLDPSVYDLPFNYDADFDFRNLRIGYVASAFDASYPNRENDQETLRVLRRLGANLVPIELPEIDFNAMDLILSVEAAAAFDELTRSGRDAELIRQMKQAWPNVFRTARFVPAVEYIQANRARTILMEEMLEAISDVDVYISPSFVGGNLLITNLTGHPSVVVPNGFSSTGMPTSITFNGHLFEEGLVLSLARAYQMQTDFHRQKPAGFVN
ncbi:MAG: amidase [Balneolia bacterium]|nr:amidase [Balneolia bacterium]